MDGIHFSSNDNFSLSGLVAISLEGYSLAVSIYNCTIGNNNKGGIYTQITDNANSRWRLINTTINNPLGFEGGIDGFTLDGGELQIDFINSINWGNGNASCNFRSSHMVSLSLTNSNLDQIPDGLPILSSTNSINSDPLFNNAGLNDWSLNLSSPCLDSGVDVGLPFEGKAPDMGAAEAGLVTNTSELVLLSDITFAPNPIRDNFTLTFDQPKEEVRLFMANINGQIIRSWQFDYLSSTQLNISDLSNGIYYLNIYSKEGFGSLTVVKQ